MAKTPKCDDCGLPYREFGLDVYLPNTQWDLISGGNDAALYCANCLALRASQILGALSIQAVIEIRPITKRPARSRRTSP